MSAKFIAQIEMSKPWVRSDNSPADATRPRIVSSSGSPAATSEPKASTMIAIVTGQERSSDFIIAALFAVLKSLQMPGDPVSETATAGVPAAFSFDLSSSAAATIAVGSPFAPAVTTAVCPSGETLAPGRGALHGGDALVRGEAALDAAGSSAGTRARRSSPTRSGRRPSAPSSRARRSSAGSASVPAPTRSRPPASRRRTAPSRPSARRPRARRRRSPTRSGPRARGRRRSGRACRPGRPQMLAGRRAGTSRYRDGRHLQLPSIPIRPCLAAERRSRSDSTDGTCWR